VSSEFIYLGSLVSDDGHCKKNIIRTMVKTIIYWQFKAKIKVTGYKDFSLIWCV